MSKQMCWKSVNGQQFKVLHIKLSDSDQWLPYTSFSFHLPDYQVPGGSKGYRTAQWCLKNGFTYQSSESV